MNVSMSRAISLIILLTALLLQGCSDSGGSLFTSEDVRIGYITKEDIIPATWVFSLESDETLASIQWQFSDEDFASHSSGRSATVTHTFNQAGLHRIRLLYETVGGKKGTAENDVIIQAGVISGTIAAALNTLVDVDTREPKEPDAENNSFASAQPLAANSRLSGVVDVDDPVDYYQVKLQKGQAVNLQVADQVNRGFKLIQFQIFRSTDTDNPIYSELTDISSGYLDTAFVADENDSYFIKLTAMSPTSNEILDDGKIIEVHSHGNYSLLIEAPIESADFVAGELLVMMKESTNDNFQSKVMSLSKMQAQGLDVRMDLGRIKVFSLTNARQFMATKNISFSASLDNNSHWQTLQAVRLLSARDDVLYAEPNWKRYPSALSPVTDPLYTSQWHYDSINLKSAWQAMDGRGDAAITVAVLDTGVLTAHPDLSPNLVAGYDFIDNDSNANDPGDKSIGGGQRSSFHGTHVAGTIAAVEGNNMGGTGIAPGVKIMPVRVLGQDGGSSFEIIAGLCFAAQLNSNDNSLCRSVPSGNAVDIINLSLGGPGFSQTEQDVYNAVIEKGIIVIAAAGNESTSAPSYPAAYDNVISVSATNRNTELASYSNFGTLIDIAAPGGDFASDEGVLSSWGDDLSGPAELTYGSLQGTSMAAPHVAGVAALMKSVKPELNHAEFRSHLIAGDLSQDIGDTGRDNKFGHGLIDAHKAVLEAKGDTGAKILSSANSLFFDVSQVTRSFTLIGSGVDDASELGVVDVRADSEVSWLSLSKDKGLGEYIATVDRGNMPEGSYEAKITVSSTVVGIENVEISVVLQIGNALLTANAGVQYVLVLDENAEANDKGEFEPVAGSSALIANNGQYSYEVTGLAKGRYTISTGSDLDFDNLICDAGESCGQYPTLTQASILEISEEQSRLEVNMTVNYSTRSTGAASVFEGELIVPRIIKKLKSGIEETEKRVISIKSKQGQ